MSHKHDDQIVEVDGAESSWLGVPSSSRTSTVGRSTAYACACQLNRDSTASIGEKTTQPTWSSR